MNTERLTLEGNQSACNVIKWGVIIGVIYLGEIQLITELLTMNEVSQCIRLVRIEYSFSLETAPSNDVQIIRGTVNCPPKSYVTVDVTKCRNNNTSQVCKSGITITSHVQNGSHPKIVLRRRTRAETLGRSPGSA